MKSKQEKLKQELIETLGEIFNLIDKRLSMHDNFEAHCDGRAENNIPFDSNGAKQMLDDDKYVLERIKELLGG